MFHSRHFSTRIVHEQLKGHVTKYPMQYDWIAVNILKETWDFLCEFTNEEYINRKHVYLWNYALFFGFTTHVTYVSTSIYSMQQSPSWEANRFSAS
jgi:hypothetical protein